MDHRSPLDQTLGYYDRAAASLGPRYESAAMDLQWRIMESSFPPGSRVLDVGCGSGRDAAWLLDAGRPASGVDGSRAMLAEAARIHPPLRGRLVEAKLPGVLPFADGAFAGLSCMAMLMHLPEACLGASIAELARICSPGGRIVASLPVERPGLGPDGVDAEGRFFLVRGVDYWTRAFRAAGLDAIGHETNSDVLARQGIVWATFVLGRGR